MTEANITIAPPAKTDWCNDIVDAMANEIRHLHKMEARGLAELRRLDTSRPVSPALMRLIAKAVPERHMGNRQLHDDEPGAHLDVVQRLALIAQIMALRPDALQKTGLGAALLNAGVSEARLSMLLHARGSIFRDLARRIAIRLARSSDLSSLPYRELGSLILLEERRSFDLRTDGIRIRVAEDYQRAISSSEKTESN